MNFFKVVSVCLGWSIAWAAIVTVCGLPLVANLTGAVITGGFVGYWATDRWM